MTATWRGRAGTLARFAANALNVVVAVALLLALVRLVLGTASPPDQPQAAGPWVWVAVLAGLGLVVGRWWIVPLALLLQPLAEQYLVFTGALRWYAFEWPFSALMLLIGVAIVGSGVLVRYGLNRVAGGAARLAVVVSLAFVVATTLAPATIWDAFIDPRPIAALGPRPSLSASEQHDRAAEVPYPVYAAAPDIGSPDSASQAVSRTPLGTVVSDIFFVVYNGEDRYGLDSVGVMTSPRDIAQPGRVVLNDQGPNDEFEEGVRIKPPAPSLDVFEEGGRTWEISSLPSNGRFYASTVVDGVRVTISARDRASFDRVAPGLKLVE